MNALEWFTRSVFVVTAGVHALPLAGVLGRKALEKAYGVNFESSDLVILLQHRALLFGLLAAASLIAVWQHSWRWPVGIMALVSMLGFVLLAATQAHGVAVARVMWVDVVLAMPMALCLLLQARAAQIS
jgi:hypothetical protein